MPDQSFYFEAFQTLGTGVGGDLFSHASKPVGLCVSKDWFSRFDIGGESVISDGLRLQHAGTNGNYMFVFLLA